MNNERIKTAARKRASDIDLLLEDTRIKLQKLNDSFIREITDMLNPTIFCVNFDIHRPGKIHGRLQTIQFRACDISMAKQKVFNACRWLKQQYPANDPETYMTLTILRRSEIDGDQPEMWTLNCQIGEEEEDKAYEGVCQVLLSDELGESQVC
jgi:hypothetical protein